MIRIDSFFPLESFTRRTWEFYDERLVVKIRSLTLDFENEVGYEKIKAIRNKRMLDLDWFWVSFLLVGLLGVAKLILDNLGITNPAIAVLEKIVVVIAFLLVIPAFRSHEWYFFLGEDKNLLITVRVHNRNKQLLLEAIKLIKQKAEITSEVYFKTPLPSVPPVFQFTEYNPPDFLSRSDVYIYEDAIIDVEKNLVEEVTSIILYEELSGKTKTVKMGNDSWGFVWSYWLILISLISIAAVVFFPNQLYENYLLWRVFIGAFLLLIPIFLMRYVKSEILIFYDKREDGIFWTRINAANREKLNQIVAFVQEKIAINNQPA